MRTEQVQNSLALARTRSDARRPKAQDGAAQEHWSGVDLLAAARVIFKARLLDFPDAGWSRRKE